MKFSIFGLKMESFPETCLALSYFPELTLSDATESGETCSLNNTKTPFAFLLFSSQSERCNIPLLAAVIFVELFISGYWSCCFWYLEFL